MDAEDARRVKALEEIRDEARARGDGLAVRLAMEAIADIRQPPRLVVGRDGRVRWV